MFNLQILLYKQIYFIILKHFGSKFVKKNWLRKWLVHVEMNDVRRLEATSDGNYICKKILEMKTSEKIPSWEGIVKKVNTKQNHFRWTKRILKKNRKGDKDCN